MTQLEDTRSRLDVPQASAKRKCALAAGLFGYSISDGKLRSFKPTEGYLRDMEQMPGFGPPSVSNFVAQYLDSNIGKTNSSS